MARHERGLYEILITEALEAQLGELDNRFEPRRTDLRAAEAADRVALHLSRVIHRAIAAVDDDERVSIGVALARRLIDVINESIAASGVALDRRVEPGAVLRAVVGLLPDGTGESIPQPLIPLLDTTLLTNAPGEPRMGNQVLTEICSADRIDLVMAFIRRSGIAPMLGALRTHCTAGRELRVLTTTYTGSTEVRALDGLRDLGAEVRVSYDTSATRLHAEAWLFHRRTGFTTAYIGSSNLTYSAQISGLEWNVRVSGARNPDVIDKVATAIWSDTPEEERRAALADLAGRRVNVVFSVDLFNEGVDVPPVDTVLMLRPRESPTLFLQQLGRGLRRSPGKTVCTVLDFVGHHRTEFRFDRRLWALLGGTRKDLIAQVEGGFPFLPAGCHMELDRIASDIVLASIRWAEDAKADLLAFTLDKTTGQFSPTTRYRDYAVSRDLIHWESQSATRADSPTGLRYQRHMRLGSSVMLFARLRTDDRAFVFLGPATYLKHESELPMAITWRLQHRLPGDLFASFAAAVA